MIISKEVEVYICNGNINYYKNKGYDCSLKDKINVKVSDLKNQSMIMITVKCDICGSIKNVQYRKYNNNVSNKGFYVCSLSCSQSKIKISKMENHGNPNFSNIEKRKETCKKLYGNENYKNIDKMKKTNMERYGVEHVIMNNDIKDKREKTYKERYSFSHPMKNKDIVEKKRKTSLYRYGNENYINKEKMKETQKNNNRNILSKKYNIDIIDYIDNKYLIKCEKGHDYYIDYDILNKRILYKSVLCTICNPIKTPRSGKEIQLYEFISNNYKGDVLSNNKIISNYELDIYIPELKLAFEFNGLFYHNEIYRSNNYHKMKTELCEKEEIQLIHIYEDDWIYKQDIVKSMILNRLNKIQNKIYARKCKIKEIYDNRLVREFLKSNHIQGFIGSSVKIGLFYSNELVSLMTFGKRRVAMGKKLTEEGEYELLRFCSKINYNIIGGANKLFKYFIDNYNPKEIITYADRSWSQGNLYEKLGFKFISKTEPNYYYIIDGIRHHRFNYRKNKLVKEGFDSSKTEHQIMLDQNIYRVYDSGSLKFILSF